jgi:hypothetical protein
MDLKSGSAPGYERGVFANPRNALSVRLSAHTQLEWMDGWMTRQMSSLSFVSPSMEPLKNESPIHIRTRSLVQLH